MAPGKMSPSTIPLLNALSFRQPRCRRRHHIIFGHHRSRMMISAVPAYYTMSFHAHRASPPLANNVRMAIADGARSQHVSGQKLMILKSPASACRGRALEIDTRTKPSKAATVASRYDLLPKCLPRRSEAPLRRERNSLLGDFAFVIGRPTSSYYRARSWYRLREGISARATDLPSNQAWPSRSIAAACRQAAADL